MAAPSKRPWQERVHQIIYESTATAGKAFDGALLFPITASILVVMPDSVASWHQRYGACFRGMELAFTSLFTPEYILRPVSIH